MLEPLASGPTTAIAIVPAGGSGVRFGAEINKVLADPTVRQRLIDAGANIAPMSIAEFADFVQAESTKYERIIRETGVKPD